jgi:hypothetical protein
MEPRFLSKAVLVKSFARIHEIKKTRIVRIDIR